MTTAQTAYDRNIFQLNETLKALQAALETHTDGEEVTWGHVGDLGHLNELATQSLNFITGTEE